MNRNFVGYKYMKASPQAETYKASSQIKSATLPSSVDLRPHHTEVENQGQIGSCTANAVVGACEYLLKKQSGKQIDLSRLFVYYNARWRKGTQDKDSGSVIQYAVESLKTLGVCSEKTWVYDPKKMFDKPNENSYKEAAGFKISDFQKVDLDLDTWKRCLAEGYPIIFGCALFGSFDNCKKQGGIVSMPTPDDTTRGSHGAHAMLCVGYSDVDQLFIVRNSWGADWGDKGYCYMPYNYLINPKFNFNDCWIIKSTGTVPNYQETWQTKPVTVINEGRGYEWYNPDEFNYYNEDDFADFDLDVIIVEYIYEDEDGEYHEEEPEDYAEEVSFFETFEPEVAFFDEFDEDGNFVGEYYEEEEGEFDEEEEEESDEEEEEFDEEEGEEEESDEEEEEESDEEEEEFDDEEEEEEEESDEEEEEFEEEEEEEESDEEEEEFEEEEEEEEPEEEEEGDFDEEEEEEEEPEEEEPEEDFGDDSGEDDSEE